VLIGVLRVARLERTRGWVSGTSHSSAVRYSSVTTQRSPTSLSRRCNGTGPKIDAYETRGVRESVRWRGPFSMGSTPALRKEHAMKRWFPLLMLLVASLVFGAGAGAQTPDDGDDGLIFRANGDVTVARDEVIEAVIVANGNARVEGSVTSTLWVISGDAIVEGSVGDDVIVIDGTLELTRGAEVENVTLIRGTLERADGAIVSGTITEQNALISLGWGAAVFSMVMWLGVTLALVVAAVVFAAVAGRHLAGAGEVVRHRFGASIVTALVLWIALPILAVMAFVTIVGIPLGVSVFLLVLPVLWIAGYLVVTTRVGDAVLG